MGGRKWSGRRHSEALSISKALRHSARCAESLGTEVSRALIVDGPVQPDVDQPGGSRTVGGALPLAELTMP